MGDPKLKKKTFRGPGHPWEKERIVEEEELLLSYGLKNKRELWKATSLQRKLMRQAKKLIALRGQQAQQEMGLFLSKLVALGLLTNNPHLEDVLNLSVRDILNRRLQTLVFKKGLAKTMRQARQFITHEHILVGSDKITFPSYLVAVAVEPSIVFSSSSSLHSLDHPERAVEPKEKEQEVKMGKVKKAAKELEPVAKQEEIIAEVGI